MPKYKVPAGENGLNIGGQQFNADKNGEITLPDDGNYTLPETYTKVIEIAPTAKYTFADTHD